MATPDGTKANPFLKDAQDVLDYTWKFDGFLDAVGDAINTFTVTPLGTPALVVSGTPAKIGANKQIQAFLSGGVTGNKYAVLCHIVTTSAPVAREKDWTIYIKISEA